MNEQRHEQVKAVFLRACELEGAERMEYLDRACGTDPQLRQEVESLLRFHMPETLLGGLSDTDVHAKPSSMAATRESWVGKLLGRHKVLRVIDSGGMGTVLEGFDTGIQRRVAIKVLHPHLADDDAIRLRFLAEARAAGQLNHPNVVTIYEVAEEADLPYLVMEYAEGGSAADRLTLHGAYSVEDATRIAIDACRGLAAAHAAGLVHRDVKPANLLVMSDGSVKVTDFGIAKAAHTASLRLTQTGQLVGTPHFMSPEQCEGSDVDLRSDIYSLGATYFSLLVGENPYKDQRSLVSVINAHCHAAPPDPQSIDDKIPAWCSGVIERAMAKQAGDRFQDMQAVEEALTQRELLPTATGPRKPSRRKLLAAAAGLPLVLLALWLFSQRGQPPGLAPAAADAPAAALPADAVAPIRIGLLHSLTGTMAQSERGMLDAYELAIEEINRKGGLLGRPLVSVIRDGQSRDAVFAQQAERLITDERVCTLFGCVTSSSRKAVREVVERRDHLLVYSVNTEGLESSPNIVYLGGGPSHTIIPALRWAYGFQGKRRFFLVGSDYVYPRVVNEMLKDEISAMGAEVVGEGYLKLGTTRVGEVVDAIQAAEPDMIINTISGDTQFIFFRTLKENGVTTPQIATGVGEEERWGLSEGESHSNYTVATYFQSLPTPTNRDFVTRFQAKFGRSHVINASMETAYAAIHLWALAVQESGLLEPAAINRAIIGQTYEAPSGSIRIDPKSRYAFRSYLIGEFQGGQDFSIVLRGPPLVPPAPFPASRNREQWGQLLDTLHAEWNGGWSAP